MYSCDDPSVNRRLFLAFICALILLAETLLYYLLEKLNPQVIRRDEGEANIPGAPTDVDQLDYKLGEVVFVRKEISCVFIIKS